MRFKHASLILYGRFLKGFKMSQVIIAAVELCEKIEKTHGGVYFQEINAEDLLIATPLAWISLNSEWLKSIGEESHIALLTHAMEETSSINLQNLFQWERAQKIVL
jgi:hypothetical protein